MDTILNTQQARLTFTVMDGNSQATDDHEDPVVASSDETVGTAAVTKTPNTGEYEMIVRSGVPSPDVERITVTVDGIVGPGENTITGVYEFMVSKDPAQSAQSLVFGAATIEPKT